jgi:hypothetical protein
MTEQNPTTPPPPAGANGQPLNPIAAALAGHIAPDPSYGGDTGDGAPPAPPATGTSVQLTDEQRGVLEANGIQVPDDGKIAVTDHLKLLDALARERSTRKTLEQQQRKQKIESLPDDERALEQARKEARDEARRELAREVAGSRVEAAAAAAGFTDPADALAHVDLDGISTSADAKAAVDKLASSKPYLVKRVSAPLPQGPQGDGAPADDPNAWLRRALGGAR